MALITCPECGGKVSDQASQCIHCGFPLDKLHEEQKSDASSLYKLSMVQFDRDREREILKLLIKITGKGLAESTRFLQSLPGNIAFGLTHANAEDMGRLFSDAGAVVEIRADPISSEPNPIMRQIETDHAAQNTLTCPRCGSTAVTTGNRGYSIVTGFWGSGKTVNRCGKCGYSWTPKG